MAIEFAGFVYDDAGAAIVGATVNLYDRNTVTPVRATDTTDSNGYWNISHATQGRFDVEITKDTWVRRRKYDDAVQLEEIEVATLAMRNPANTYKYDITPAAITADRVLTLPLITGSDTLASLGLAQNFTAQQTFSGDVLVESRNTLATLSTKTIATGVITVTKNFHRVETESAAATDDLDTINGYVENSILYLVGASGSGRTATVKHGTGNIRLTGNADYALDGGAIPYNYLILLYMNGNWHELHRIN